MPIRQCSRNVVTTLSKAWPMQRRQVKPRAAALHAHITEHYVTTAQNAGGMRMERSSEKRKARVFLVWLPGSRLRIWESGNLMATWLGHMTTESVVIAISTVPD